MEWRDSQGDMRDSPHGYGTRNDAVAAARALGLIKEPRMRAKPPLEDRKLKPPFSHPRL